ncbi:hypothetical protein FraQA3DRAFT_1846 [Frankia sp. QA3]|nr:hypothetical protein FraQA3DRAFT_1846 [Frankia sp. QA3]
MGLDRDWFTGNVRTTPTKSLGWWRASLRRMGKMKTQVGLRVLRRVRWIAASVMSGRCCRQPDSWVPKGDQPDQADSASKPSRSSGP